MTRHTPRPTHSLTHSLIGSLIFRRLPGVVAVAALAAVVASGPVGCSTAPAGASAQAGGAGSFNGAFDPVGIRRLGLTPRWIYKLARAGEGVTFGRVFDDTLVLIEGEENIVTAIDAGTGALNWKRQVGSELTRLSGATALGDDLFIASNARLFKLDRDTGEQLAFSPLAQPVVAPSVSDGPLAAYGGANGLAFGIDLRSTGVRWQYRFPGALVAPPVISGSDVFIADARGTYAALDLRTGSLRWRNRVFGGVVAAPVVHRGNILVPSEDRTLYALSRSDGSESWTYRADTPLTRSPLSVGLNAYLPVPGGNLVALSADGDVLWTSDQPILPLGEAPGGVLGFTDGALVVFDPADGRILGRAAAARPTRSIGASDGALVLILDNRTVVRLDPINQ